MNHYLREFCGALVFLMSVCGFPMTICDLLTSLSWLVKFGYELFYELYGPTYESLWLNKMTYRMTGSSGHVARFEPFVGCI